MKKGLLLFFALTVVVVSLYAQTGIGTPTPHPDASLELGASDKGLLLNRVALTGTANPVPLSAHVVGMTVYNTATAGDVTPGYYYNNGTQWVRIGNPDEEPFRNVSDGSAATNASTDIYYGGGNVGIGTNNPVNRLTISGVDNNQPQALITSPSSAITGNYGIAYRALGVGGVWTGYLGNNPNIPLPGAAVIAGSGKNLYLMAGSQTGEGNAMDPSDPGNVPRITVLENNGNVGIGTTTPTAPLEINNGSTAGALRIIDGTQGLGKVLSSDANGVATWSTTVMTAFADAWTPASGTLVNPFAGGAGSGLNTGLSVVIPEKGWYFFRCGLTIQSNCNDFFFYINGIGDVWRVYCGVADVQLMSPRDQNRVLYFATPGTYTVLAGKTNAVVPNFNIGNPGFYLDFVKFQN